jgi:hypothetical protein
LHISDDPRKHSVLETIGKIARVINVTIIHKIN